MNVTEAIKSRISTRAFLDTPVSEQQVREILDIARWSPSGANLQPWTVHVVMGGGMTRLLDIVRNKIAENPTEDESEINIYPPKLEDPWRTRRYQLGEEMYEKLGIARDNKMGRLARFAKNYEFFDAPAGLFFSVNRRFDKPQWAHLGMFMLSIALVAKEKGLATCMQEAWAARARTVSDFLNIPETDQLYCGMALGYADKAAKVNELRSSRVRVEEFTKFITE